MICLARSARRWGGGNVAQAEPGTQLEDTWPMEGLCTTYKYQLATQVDRGRVHLSQKSDSETTSSRASRTVLLDLVVKGTSAQSKAAGIRGS